MSDVNVVELVWHEAIHRRKAPNNVDMTATTLREAISEIEKIRRRWHYSAPQNTISPSQGPFIYTISAGGAPASLVSEPQRLDKLQAVANHGPLPIPSVSPSPDSPCIV